MHRHSKWQGGRIPAAPSAQATAFTVSEVENKGQLQSEATPKRALGLAGDIERAPGDQKHSSANPRASPITSVGVKPGFLFYTQPANTAVHKESRAEQGSYVMPGEESSCSTLGAYLP